MENPIEHQEAPKPERRRSFVDLVLGAVVALLFAGAVMVAAVLAFDVNPAAPVVVVVAAIAGGSYAARRVEEPALEAAAIGLIVGGLAALLLWPLFDVG
jgi:quinol-cytochrome oxidoreductase complex cytochrome b subunit